MAKRSFVSTAVLLISVLAIAAAEIPRICEKYSKTYSGKCDDAKCDKRCIEWEKAAHGTCHKREGKSGCFCYYDCSSAPPSKDVKPAPPGAIPVPPPPADGGAPPSKDAKPAPPPADGGKGDSPPPPAAGGSPPPADGGSPPPADGGSPPPPAGDAPPPASGSPPPPAADGGGSPPPAAH